MPVTGHYCRPFLLALAAGALVTVGVVAGCGGGSSSGAGPEGAQGTGGETFSTDGGPEFLAFDGVGNLYVSDCFAARVFVIDESGTMRVAVGSGQGVLSGYSGDGGQAAKAEVSCPEGVAVGDDGTLYLGDHGNNRVRKITAHGVISTFAGSGPIGPDRGTLAGDGGPALSARLQEPLGVTLDGDGNLYIADRDNDAIRKVGTDGVIMTIAGGNGRGFSGDGGPAVGAKLSQPHTIGFDKQGNLYFTDSGNNRVRKIDADGMITTFAGDGEPGSSGDGKPAAQAELGSPDGLAVDSEGDLYVSEPAWTCIRRIDEAGVITTIAGNCQGEPGFSGDGGKATGAILSTPAGLAFDADGNLYVADMDNHRVRVIDASGTITTFYKG